jgi:hypothetical protein
VNQDDIYVREAGYNVLKRKECLGGQKNIDIVWIKHVEKKMWNKSKCIVNAIILWNETQNESDV